MQDDDKQSPAPAEEKALELPDSAPAAKTTGRSERRPDPTRYGDWEVGGRCIDF